MPAPRKRSTTKVGAIRDVVERAMTNVFNADNRTRAGTLTEKGRSLIEAHSRCVEACGQIQAQVRFVQGLNTVYVPPRVWSNDISQHESTEGATSTKMTPLAKARKSLRAAQLNLTNAEDRIKASTPQEQTDSFVLAHDRIVEAGAIIEDEIRASLDLTSISYVFKPLLANTGRQLSLAAAETTDPQQASTT